MSIEERREEARKLLESHVGMLPGSPRKLTDEEKDELWKEIVDGIEDNEDEQ